MTHNQIILTHLQTRSITQLEALRLYGCMRLGARIYDLRELGHDIKTVMVGDGRKQYARYYLIKQNENTDNKQA